LALGVENIQIGRDAVRVPKVGQRQRLPRRLYSALALQADFTRLAVKDQRVIDFPKRLLDRFAVLD
jgi:hypothetical protein